MPERELDDRHERPGIPDATVARLPLYHRVLLDLVDQGANPVSSDALAAAAGVSPAKLRKDLSFLGSYGTRGVGYDVGLLLTEIGRELGITLEWPVVVVGFGNLGHALTHYDGFTSRGFRIAGVVDADPGLQDESVAGVQVQPLAALDEIVRTEQVQIAIIATPAEAAQSVADALVAAGVRSILNFAPVVLNVPADVYVRRVDLASELQILAFHEQRKVVGSLPVGSLPASAAGGSR